MAIKTLILCTGNSCRSILFEALLSHYVGDKFSVFSAGSNPAGQVNPFSIKTLEKYNIPTSDLRSKSWDEFKDVEFDLIITVCGEAASEFCPVFLGKGVKIHLGFDDPAKFIGDEEQTQLEFDKCFNNIRDLVLQISSIEINNKTIAQISKEITNFYNK
jgi:arsenate reductase